jgi:hypothetical protein
MLFDQFQVSFCLFFCRILYYYIISLKYHEDHIFSTQETQGFEEQEEEEHLRLMRKSCHTFYFGKQLQDMVSILVSVSLPHQNTLFKLVLLEIGDSDQETEVGKEEEDNNDGDDKSL